MRPQAPSADANPQAHCTPSPAQWAALRGLRQRGPLCLQLHWRWQPGPSPLELMQALHQRLASQRGTRLSDMRGDHQFVGAPQALWHTMSLWQLPNASAVERLVKSPEFRSLAVQAEAVTALVIKPAGIGQQLLFGALGLVLRRLPKPAPSAGVHKEIVGGVNPTPEQLAALEAADQESPVHMFNLLKFHAQARYPDGSRGRTGSAAYTRHYGPASLQAILRLGGQVVKKGDYLLTLVGAEGEPATGLWDEVAVVYYPNRALFQQMTNNPTFNRATEHRMAALAVTELWSGTPLPR